MVVLATLKPKSSYRLQWLSSTCPNFFLVSQLSCCGKREFAPEEGNQGVLFISTSFPSVIVYSWVASLPIQSSKHQVLIVNVLALNHNCKKWKSSLCCGPFGCWQCLEIQSRAGGACVVLLPFIAPLSCPLTSTLIYVSQDAPAHLFLISWVCIYFLAES